MTDFGRITSLVSHIPMFLTTNLLTALADRVGRRPIMLIFFFGIMLNHVIWALITRSEDGFFRENWKPVFAVSVFFTGAMGNFALGFFFMFSLISDFCKYRPNFQSPLFALLQGGIATGSVVGSQLAGVLMKKDPYYCFTTCFTLAAILFALTLFVLPDTTPAEVRAREVDWKRANAIGAAMFLLPFEHTLQLRAEDSRNEYNLLCEAKLRGHRAAQAVQLNGDTADHLDDLGSLRGDGAVPHISRSPSRGNMATFSADAADSSAIPLGVVSDDMPASDIDVDASLPEHAVHSAAAKELIAAGVALPEPPAPPGNTLLVISITVGLFMFANIGFESSFMSFMKQVYRATDTQMSNITTIEAVARLVGMFVFVPLAHRLIKTRLGELRLTQLFFIIVGLTVAAYHLATGIYSIATLAVISGTFTIIPGGYVRSIVTSEVGTLAQGKALAAITAVELSSSVLGSFIFSTIYSATNKTTPSTVFIVGGFSLVAAALVPFFINDSAEVFNSRKRKTVTSTSAAEVEEQSDAAKDAVVTRIN
jgi:MFS family permease